MSGTPINRTQARAWLARREPTVQLGLRVPQDVSDVIEELTTHDGTA